MRFFLRMIVSERRYDSDQNIALVWFSCSQREILSCDATHPSWTRGHSEAYVVRMGWTEVGLIAFRLTCRYCIDVDASGTDEQSVRTANFSPA